jgi:hypothetical protein
MANMAKSRRAGIAFRRLLNEDDASEWDSEAGELPIASGSTLLHGRQKMI